MQADQHEHPQIKICGLTRPDEAAQCARAGADAVGLVFFAKSPRNVTIDQARVVVDALPRTIAAVGVFVNEDFDYIMTRVDRCGLAAVQLHGRETPALADQLLGEGVGVIKAFFVDGQPNLEAAVDYNVDGYLVECAKGPLPGGNAMAWDWKTAEDFGRRYPLVLAGGLFADNVGEAIAACRPVAIDVSSGVESSPGRKDGLKVSRFIAAVKSNDTIYGDHVRHPVFTA